MISDKYNGADPLEVLRGVWGYDAFRPRQEQIVRSVLAGHDTLGLLPTGGGKSITFQVPALILPGLTVVVTPLVSLMKDQVDNLAAREVRAVYLWGGMSARESRLAYGHIENRKAKLLYIAPERLHSQTFLAQLRQWPVSLLVVDEAHCISQWGYDFRPQYLAIGPVRDIIGRDVPVLAVTASATGRVADDIRRQLRFRPGHNTFRLSFDRDNLNYIVRYPKDKLSKLVDVLRAVGGTAIVYTRSRQRTVEVAEMLVAAGINATAYHAGLDLEVKTKRQEDWKNGLVRVIVATNAFGMGIDKPDVRLVVHIDLPPSLEEYYQEAGRAGRDGKPAFAVVLCNSYDKANMTKRIKRAFPPLDYVRMIYNRVCVAMDVPLGEGYMSVHAFDAAQFAERNKLDAGEVAGSLQLLCRAGYFDYNDSGILKARVQVLMPRHEMYNMCLSVRDEKVLTYMMRIFTGLFADLQPISEAQIASEAKMPQQEVHEALLSLSRQKIIKYIPRRAVPHIMLTTAREKEKYVVLPDSVYAQRRALMQQRQQSVLDFVFDREHCRVHTLLRYFDEEPDCGCGQCDVCRARKKQIGGAPYPEMTDTQVDDAVMASVAHNRPVRLPDLCLALPLILPARVQQSVQRLVCAGRLSLTGISLTLPD